MITYDDDYVRTLHPRQQTVLLPVPVEARRAIIGRAHLIQNTRPGYIFSQAMQVAVDDLARLGGDLAALEELDRRDNHAAMGACARNGCTACARDAARLS